MKFADYVEQAIEDNRKIDIYSHDNQTNPVDIESMKLINYSIREQPGLTIDDIFKNPLDPNDETMFFDRQNLIFSHMPSDSFKRILHLRSKSHQKVYTDPEYRNAMYDKLMNEVAPVAGIMYS